VNILVKKTFEWVTNMGDKTNVHRIVLKCLPTVRPIPSNHNPPPKHASSLLGSRRAYNRLMTISNLGRKAKIDVGIRNHVGEGLAAVVIEESVSRDSLKSKVANECLCENDKTFR
jgi:hypothetical protein